MKIFRSLFFLACLSALGASLVTWVQSTPTTYDQYWHAKTGHDFIFKGKSPLVDHYSFSYQGKPIKLQPYAFQALYGILVDSFSFETATVFLKIIGTLSFLLSLLLLVKKTRCPPLASLTIGVIAVYFFISRLLPRPELFDFSLISIAFIAYHHAITKGGIKALAILAAICWGWTNYHAGILGYVIFSGFFVQAFWLLLNKSAEGITWKTFWIFGVFIFCLGFLTKDFQHPILEALTFSDAWANISEHRPSLEGIDQRPQLWGIWTLAICTFFWGGVVRKFGLSFVVAVFLYASLERIRMVPISGVAIACAAIILAADENTKSLYKSLNKKIQTTISLLSIFLILLVLSQLPFRVQVDHHHINEFPDKSITYLSSKYDGGNIFNVYHLGGHLIYSLPTDFKVFIDGRTNILYEEDFYLEYLNAIKGNIVSIASINERYDLNFALWPIEKRMNFLLYRHFNLSAEYIGNRSVLYSRNGKLQQLADALNTPACGRLLEPEAFKGFIKIVENQSPNNQALVEALNIVITQAINVIAAQDFVAKFGTKLSANYDHLYRFLAYIAIEADEYEAAGLLLSEVAEKTTLDGIHATYSYLEAGNLEYARGLIVQLSTEYWLTSSKKRTMSASQAEVISGLHDRLITLKGSNSATDQVVAKMLARFSLQPNKSRTSIEAPLPTTGECRGLVQGL